jgi:PilZ domain
MGWSGPDQRRAPRIDVLRRVRGTLIPIDSPVVVRDLSRTGFGALSHIAFHPGDVLTFRLESGADNFTIAARVVHTRPFANSSGLFVTGFEFVPGEMFGLAPLSRIDQLVEAVTVREGLLDSN